MEMLEEKIRELYRIAAELEEKYPGRRFTPDGHLVGSIGEVYAAEKYGLTLLETGSEKHDACSADGRLIQIKITQTDRISIYSEPDYYPLRTVFGKLKRIVEISDRDWLFQYDVLEDFYRIARFSFGAITVEECKESVSTNIGKILFVIVDKDNCS